MGNKKKPNLAGIKEFRAAAYIKDLTAGKLDAWAKKGQFVGYDSESKGYQVYWPEKWSITVKRNVVFNQDNATTHDDTAIIYGKLLSEEEKEKVIQNPKNNITNFDQPANKDSEDQQAPEKEPEPHQSPKSTNTVRFPMSEELQNDPDAEPQDTSQPLNQQYGHGQWARPEKGHYKAINNGLVAAITAIVEDTPEEDDVNDPPSIHDLVKSDDADNNYELLPDIPLMGYTHLDPKMLDEAPNAKEWEEALKYKKNQLEKLGTWVVKDLPPGQSAILCSEVVQVKHGPDSEVQTYQVRIVAGGHRQFEGVNYTKTFSATTKMPIICIVLTNAAHQDWETEHIDIKIAYLNAPLKEVIYMKAPRGVLEPGQEGKVLRLLKGLYRLKQAERGWYMEMVGVFMNKLGFKRSAINHLVFHQRTGKEHIIVAVATDNMAVTSKRSVNAEWFKSDIKHF